MEAKQKIALVAQVLNQEPYPVAKVDRLVVTGLASPGRVSVAFMMVLDRTPGLVSDYPYTAAEGMVVASASLTPAEVTALIVELAEIPGVELPKTED